MDILTVFLNKIAYKFPKGYPDINNKQDRKFLLEIIKMQANPLPFSFFLQDKNHPLFEGISFSDGKYKFSPKNGPTDLLHYSPGTAERKQSTIFYSFEINPDLKDGEKFKQAADAIKNLDDIVDFESLEEPIKKGIIQSMTGLKPDLIYYLGSSKGLSSLLGSIAQEVYSDVEVLPLNKKTFLTWEDMLVDNYKELINEPKRLALVQKEAQRMFTQEKGKIKSSGYMPQLRKYFKPKYELDEIAKVRRVLFLDDNVQSGLDLNTIEKSLGGRQCFFYTPILLPIGGSKLSNQQKASKTTKVDLTKKDLKLTQLFKTFTQNGEKHLYLSVKHPKFKRLLDKKFIEKDSLEHPTLGRFHKFSNPKIRSIEDITPID